VISYPPPSGLQPIQHHSTDPGDWLSAARFNTLVAAGDKNLHYVTADKLYQFNPLTAVDPDHLISPTVGGCHPSDLGQMAVASFYSAFLPTLLPAATEVRTDGVRSAAVVGKAANWPQGKRAQPQEAEAHCDELVRLQQSHPSEGIPKAGDFEFTDIESSDL